jgi:hypothetical protein
MEFRGVVNINEAGEIVCFCSRKEALQGKCLCRNRDDCPEAIINIEVIPNSRPSEVGIKKISKTNEKVRKEVIKIKEGLTRLEDAVKRTRFRI